MAGSIRPGDTVCYTRLFIEDMGLDPNNRFTKDEWPFLLGTVVAFSRFNQGNDELLATIEWTDGTVDRVSLASLEQVEKSQ